MSGSLVLTLLLGLAVPVILIVVVSQVIRRFPTDPGAVGPWRRPVAEPPGADSLPDGLERTRIALAMSEQEPASGAWSVILARLDAVEACFGAVTPNETNTTEPNSGHQPSPRRSSQGWFHRRRGVEEQSVAALDGAPLAFSSQYLDARLAELERLAGLTDGNSQTMAASTTEGNG